MTPRRIAWILAWTAPLTIGLMWQVALDAFGVDHRINSFPGGLVVGMAITAAITDALWRRIPNWCTYPAVIWALVFGLMVTVLDPNPPEYDPVKNLPRPPDWWTVLGPMLGPNDLRSVGQGLGICFFATFFIYSLSGGGAGDVKMGAALGALLGFADGVRALLVAYIVGGTGILVWAVLQYGPIYLILHFLRKLGSMIIPSAVAPVHADDDPFRRKKVALAPFFAIGIFAAIFRTQLHLPWLD